MSADELNDHLARLVTWALQSCAETEVAGELAAVALFNPGEVDTSALASSEVRGVSAPERAELVRRHGATSAFNAADWRSVELTIVDWSLPEDLDKADQRISKALTKRLGANQAASTYQRCFVDALADQPWAERFRLPADFVVFSWDPDVALRSAELRRRGPAEAVQAWEANGWLR